MAAVGLGGSPLLAVAQPAPEIATPALADCNGDAPARVLLPAARHEADARAYWLDRQHLQWPGAAPGGRFVLYRSATASLRAIPGERVRGADGGWPLDLRQGAPADDSHARFAFIGAGPRLRLPAQAVGELPAALTGQLLLVREDDQGRVLDATGVQVPGVLDDLYASAGDLDTLGARATPGRTHVSVWAPTARRVWVCLYPDDRTPASAAWPLQRDAATGAWSRQLSGDLRGHYYRYLVDVFVPGTGVVRNRVTDPYAASLGADSRRAYIADLDDPALKPEGWDAAARPPAPAAQTDMVVYELHVRDFSIGDRTVAPAHRGKFLAFADRGSAGMRHLRALAAAGLTDVHLLPVFDFASVPETGCVTPRIPDAPADGTAQQAAVQATAARDCFNWGYDPFHFNAPEGSYASDASDGAARIREMRAMVMALHAAGLRVGMDVVYNHTSASGQSPRSVLDRIVPGYYHRLDARGAVEHSTCCENTATEHRMMAKLMADSVAGWVRDYRIDSFRFDLMGHQPRSAMEQVRRRAEAVAGRPVPLIGEGWNFGEVADGARFVQAAQGRLAGSGIATFSDRARDAIRGGGCCDSGADLVAAKGYINGLAEPLPADAAGTRRKGLLHAADMVRVGLAGTLAPFRLRTADGRVRALSELDYKGAPAGYATQPSEVVNYVENHDNATLFDIDVLRLPRATSSRERARVQLLGDALVAFSQGIAYFHAGTELLRSKSLDRNSFDSGDWFNPLDWSGRDNGFGRGLPPAPDNGKDWALLRPFLADASIRPTPADIAWMRDAFADLLRIRRSSSLFRMRTAADIQARLSFPNAGPGQDPRVMAVHLLGRGYPAAGFDEVLVLVNVSTRAESLDLPGESGKAYVLHPVQRAATAADRRPATGARYHPGTGRFEVPPRTAVVYVVPASGAEPNDTD